MSAGAYLLAVRDAIRTSFAMPAGTADLTCEVMYDGQPKPNAPREFWAVHLGGWSAQSGDADLNEFIGVTVTYSRTTGDVPPDRWGIFYAQTIEPRLRQAVAVVHKSYAVMAAANEYITASGLGSDLFCEPLQFSGSGGPQPRGPDWWNAPMPQSDLVSAQLGMSQQLTFGRARRMQYFSSIG